MTDSNFALVMAEVFKHEVGPNWKTGGLVNHPKDPGGLTKFGISQRSYPGVDIRNLTRKEAESYYIKDYWKPCAGPDFPKGFDLVVMDGSVNSGVSRGVKWLQRALGVKVDGEAGPMTIKAAKQAMSGDLTIQRACNARLGFMRGLKIWNVFKRGWSRRVADIEAVGGAMWLHAYQIDGARIDLINHADDAERLIKPQKNAAKASVTGSTGTAIGGDMVMEPWMIAAVVVAFLVVALEFWGRARHDKARALAYHKAAIGAK